MENNKSYKEAVEAMDSGKRTKRFGWEDIFIFKQIPATIPDSTIPNMQSLPDSVKAVFAARGGEIRYSNQCCIVYPDNSITSWAPSIQDATAEDWIILD